jgi:hypothetical protein
MRIGIGGASRDRTDGLVVANDALSQLSYSPVNWMHTSFTNPFYQRSRVRTTIRTNSLTPCAIARTTGYVPKTVKSTRLPRTVTRVKETRINALDECPLCASNLVSGTVAQVEFAERCLRN